MKPNEKWIDDWKVGQEASRENSVATDLVNYFQHFWEMEKLDKKSKSTNNRYSNSLHALGGFLVNQAIFEEDLDKSAHDLLLKYIGPDEGPLIHDIEDWQDELDMVCRKIYKHLLHGGG